MQIDVTLQNNGACEPQTFRNDYFTPSFVVHYFDSLINSLRVQRHPIAFCSEITDIYLIIGKNGTLYGGHGERKVCIHCLQICLHIHLLGSTLTSTK